MIGRQLSTLSTSKIYDLYKAALNIVINYIFKSLSVWIVIIVNDYLIKMKPLIILYKETNIVVLHFGNAT